MGSDLGKLRNGQILENTRDLSLHCCISLNLVILPKLFLTSLVYVVQVPGLIFGHFSTKSTQLKLAVFEGFFGIWPEGFQDFARV